MPPPNLYTFCKQLPQPITALQQSCISYLLCVSIQRANTVQGFLPARRSNRSICYNNVAGWLDVTCQYCIKMAKPILKLFRPPGSPIILVSSDPCANNQFQGIPFSGGVNYTGGGRLLRPPEEGSGGPPPISFNILFQ